MADDIEVVIEPNVVEVVVPTEGLIIPTTIEQLTDTDTSSSQDNDFLRYNASTQRWTNENVTFNYFTASDAVNAITGSDLDMGGNKVLFANKYDNLADLPNATTYHGMFAHVHATGKAYFAHAGEWQPLANDTSTSNQPTNVRVSETQTTGSLANNATTNLTFSTLGKSYIIYSIEVDRGAWVRVYSDAAARTADAGRLQDSDPAEGIGLIGEVVSSAATTYKVTPGIAGYIHGTDTTVPVAVTNLSGSASTVQVIINVLKLEV